jgi:hypothetical protein
MKSYSNHFLFALHFGLLISPFGIHLCIRIFRQSVNVNVISVFSLEYYNICVYKGKVLPRTGHEGPEGSRGIALLFL